MGDFVSGFLNSFNSVWSDSRQRELEEARRKEQNQLRLFQDAAQSAAQRGDVEGVANVFRMQSEFVRQGDKGGKKGKQGQMDVMAGLADALESGLMPVGMQSKEDLQNVNPINAPQQLTQQSIQPMQVTPNVMPIASGTMGFNQQGNPELQGRSLQTQDIQPQQQPRMLQTGTPAPPVQSFENRKRFMTPQSELDEKAFLQKKRLLDADAENDTKKALQVQKAMLERQTEVENIKAKARIELAQGLEKRDVNKLVNAIKAENPLISDEAARAQAGGMITDKFRVSAEDAASKIQYRTSRLVNFEKQLNEKIREYNLTYGQRERQGNARIGIMQQNANTAKQNADTNASGLMIKQQISDAGRVKEQMGQIITESNRLQGVLSNSFSSVEAKAQAERRLEVLDRNYDRLDSELRGLRFDVDNPSVAAQGSSTSASNQGQGQTVNIGGKDFQVGGVYDYKGKKVRVDVENGQPKLTVVQ